MKIRLFSLLLVVVLAVPALSGCQAARSAGRSVERGVESVEQRKRWKTSLLFLLGNVC